MTEPAAPPPRSRRRARVLLVLGSTFLALVVLEVALRLGKKEPWPLEGHALADVAFHENFDFPDAARGSGRFPFALDPPIGYALKQNTTTEVPFDEAPGGRYTIATNALGLRDRARGPKPAGTKRVLALGDSMTFGVGVEHAETWPAVLEARLARAGPVEVASAAVPGWGQQEELAFLRDPRARLLAPDVVVLGLCVSNDVLDDLRYRDGPGDLVPDPRVRGDLERHWLLENPLAGSRLYRALLWSHGRHVLRYRAMKDPARLARVARLVDDIRDAAAALGAKTVVLVAPTIVQVDGGFQERVLGTRAINESFLASARGMGLPAVEPFEPLRVARRAGGHVYFERDMHWTKEGHLVVAEALEAPVRALLPP